MRRIAGPALPRVLANRFHRPTAAETVLVLMLGHQTGPCNIAVLVTLEDKKVSSGSVLIRDGTTFPDRKERGAIMSGR